MSDAVAYKILTADQWRALDLDGRFAGAPVDLADGYIHLSTAAQLGETAAKHFAGQDGLIVAAVDIAALGEAIRWEVSRGGALFPHLYGALTKADLLWAEAMPLVEGRHQLPRGLPAAAA
ncbi:DUF952 domain-containing protein [Sphingomonas quercus]|uniref:DUF952 domain-containing protein n=1 Tax=Sphingomonas quercus TaxID=2842451 RepID=A0ABS6BKA6_9SPHN|nr:DUF952 domain-containing protein [Sphingomonas quercus]MBU3078735.1 DUF952 domain-containing protein [Sphingomonas quercus]